MQIAYVNIVASLLGRTKFMACFTQQQVMYAICILNIEMQLLGMK